MLEGAVWQHLSWAVWAIVVWDVDFVRVGYIAERADMHLVYGSTNGNGQAVVRLYHPTYPAFITSKASSTRALSHWPRRKSRCGSWTCPRKVTCSASQASMLWDMYHRWLRNFEHLLWNCKCTPYGHIVNIHLWLIHILSTLVVVFYFWILAYLLRHTIRVVFADIRSSMNTVCVCIPDLRLKFVQEIWNRPV